MTGRLAAAMLMTLVIASASAIQAQTSHWGSAHDPIVKEMVAKEKMWLDSDCSQQPGLKDVIADDFQATAPNGERTDKAEAISNGPNWPARDCQLGPVKVRFFGDNLAIVYGSESSLKKAADGKVAKRCLVWTDTWLRRDNKWQIIAAQDTRVECK